MHKRYFIIGYRLFFGLLALVAVVVQLFHGLERPNFSVVNFFSFFTIESNVLAIVVFLATSLLLSRGMPGSKLAFWRGAAMVFMTTTGIIYVLLLSGLEESLQTPVPWINTVLHYIMPAAVFVDWFVDLPKQRIPFKTAALWLIFPLVYAAYSLIRGLFVNWYPYPFLNPQLDHGYVGVAITSVVIGIVLAGFVWLVAASTRLGSKPARS